MPFFIQLLAFFGIFISFTSSLSNRVGDNCVNCRKDVLLPAIRDNIQVVTPTIGDCKNCNNKLTKNNGHTLTSVVYKENHSLDVLTILVTSDGSQARPYCSWNGACRYDSSVETVCAEKLCEASGFSYDSSTVFVSSSGNMCESGNNIIDGYVWYYLVNQGYYEYGNYYLESAITARCVDSSTFTSIQPSQYPTTTSTTGKPTARLSSPSSKPTSYPSFRPTSNPNNTRKPTSRAPVKPTPVPSRRQPSRRPSKLPTVNPTAVTPSIAGSLITSDGSQARPYCTWSNVCQYDLSVEILCAAKLCEASGFSYDPSTVFVSSSGSMCVYDIYQGYAWYYVVDVGDYNYSDYILESTITARCTPSNPSIKPTRAPSRRPTRAPSRRQPTRAPSRRQSSRRPSKLPTVNPSMIIIDPAPTSGTLITSDGSQARPYCTWSNVCQYDLSVEILCAEKLCEASGFSYDSSTVFVSSSGSMCVYDIYQGYAWYYVVDVGDYNYSDYILESAITARCVA